MQLADALAQLGRETERARRVIGRERALTLALPILLGAGVWVALWLLGLPQRLPGLAQSLIVIAALAALGVAIWFTRRRYVRPTQAEARARLAQTAQLDPNTFEALHDQPTSLSSPSVALWRAAQARARADAARVRPARFQPDLSGDRFKLRYVIGAALLIGIVFAGADTGERLLRAFAPNPGPLLGDGPIAVEAWLTPAPYTRGQPVALSDSIGATVPSPPSVTATVRVTGPRGAPVLVFEGQGGHREVRFTRTADGAWQAELALSGAGRLRVVRFFTAASWRIQPAPDRAPRAALVEAPTQGAHETLSLQWRARDDFGVRSMALRVTPLNPPEGLRGAPPVDTPFESPSGDPREAQGAATLDLAEHPYAGMQVEVRVVAFDALGQAGESGPIRMTLPEKVFLQPLARAAIEIRRMVLWERRAYRGEGRPEQRRTIPAGDIVLGNERIEIRGEDSDRRIEHAPPGIVRAVNYLDALMMNPRDGYFRDRAIFLGLAYANANLINARNSDETTRAADTLWRVALRAEYGGAGDARRALEEAQRQLAEALRNGAPPERLRQLTQAMREATQRYMQALVQEAMREGTQETQEDTEEQTSLSRRDIERMMREVEELTRQGRHDEAEQRLQQLANILQNLDVQLTNAEQSGEDGEDGEQEQSELSQSMDQLSQAIGEQRALNDDTQQQQSGQGQGGDQQQQNGQGARQSGELASRQQGLRQRLAEARSNARAAGGESDGSLSNAEQAMRRAEDALRRGDFQDARAAQDEALSSLRRGANELAEQMRSQENSEAGNEGSGERDPLGRAVNGAGAAGEGDQNVIPTQSERVRAREILDDIRRRAQDPNRPESEREYLRRLLERFNGT